MLAPDDTVSSVLSLISHGVFAITAQILISAPGRRVRAESATERFEAARAAATALSAVCWLLTGFGGTRIVIPGCKVAATRPICNLYYDEDGFCSTESTTELYS